MTNSSHTNQSKKAIAPPLEKEILPGIKATQKQGAIAFEIPLDDLVAGSNKTLKDQSSSLASSKKSLPKLDVSESDIRAKLANADEIWKVTLDLITQRLN